MRFIPAWLSICATTAFGIAFWTNDATWALIGAIGCGIGAGLPFLRKHRGVAA